MADKTEDYRGHEIAYFWSLHTNNKVGFLIWSKSDYQLPMHGGPPEADTLAAAEQVARELIDQAIAKPPPKPHIAGMPDKPAPKPGNETYNDEEAARRTDATIRAMIGMKPKPHRPRSDRAAPWEEHHDP
jgi:hypothetical protein